jgi:arylsulfatase A-like enzyme
VLLVVVDALRPDHVGANGYPLDTTPRLDRLAANGVLFNECRSTSTWTRPAVSSLFSGVGPMVHGVERRGLRKPSPVSVLQPSFETMAELFRRHGFSTMAFTSNPNVGESAGLTQGFDEVTRCAQFGPGLVDDFLRWLDLPFLDRTALVQRLSRRKENLLPAVEQLARRLPMGFSGSVRARHLELKQAVNDGQRRCVSLPLARVPRTGGPYLLGMAHRVGTLVGARVIGSSGFRMNLLPSTTGQDPEVETLQWVTTADDDLSLEVCFAPASRSFGLSSMFLVPSAAARPEVVSKWFAYLHLLNPHLPYISMHSDIERFRADDYGGQPIPIPPEALDLVVRQRVPDTEDLRVYRARYDASVHDADEGFGRIVDHLEKLRLLDDTLIVVTADHGEQFLEHGWLSHGGKPYDELLRVPLIFYYPKGLASGVRVAGAVSLLDLYPTLAEILRFDPTELLAGRSLRAALTGGRERAPSRPFVTTHTSMAATDTSRTDVVVEEGLKLLVSSGPDGETRAELYDLRTDPGETRNLSQERPEDVCRLQGLLDAERRRQKEQRSHALKVAPVSAPDESTLRLLEALGYAEE